MESQGPAPFVNASTLAMFPTYAWVFDLRSEDYEPLNETIYRRVLGVLPETDNLNFRHSVQTETNLQEFEALAPLMEYVKLGAQRIIEFYDYETTPMRVTGCWANVGVSGAYHYEHSHANNFLSGVYYVRAPKGGDAINFHDPRLQAHVIAPRARKLSPKHAASLLVSVKVGRMVFFPSWLRHSVDVNKSEEMRLSVSFNLMFDTFAEQMSAPRFQGSLSIGDPE